MAIIGNAILSGGSAGGGVSSLSSLINVPITISLNEPTPERVGHLWVVSENEPSITRVEFNDVINPDATDGTLQVVTPVTQHHLDLAQYMKVGTRKVIATLESGNTISHWVIGDAENGDEHCKLCVDTYPLVYSNIDGARYIENAYVWSGSEWFMCCQKDTYLFMTYGAKSGLYNIIDYSSTIPNNIIGNTLDRKYSAISPKGGYMFDSLNKKVLKKVGDVYQDWADIDALNAVFSPNEGYVFFAKTENLGSVYKILPEGLYHLQDMACSSFYGLLQQRVAFSQDNSSLAVLLSATVNSSTRPHIVIYKLNYTTGLYGQIDTYTFESGSFSSNAMGLLWLSNNKLLMNTMSQFTINYLTLDDNGLVVNAGVLFNSTREGSYNLSNNVYCTSDGKWVFYGSYSTNLGMNLNTSTFNVYVRRGHMIVINTVDNFNKAYAIYDGTMSVRGVFEVDGDIKVLCYIDGYGYVIVTYRDEGTDRLTYIGQQLILGYEGVATSYSTACPVVSQ